MQAFRVLVIGGYGFFGSRLLERLVRQSGLHIVVGGRSAEKAHALVERLRASGTSMLSATTLDILSPTFKRDLAALAPALTIHTSGPFQAQDYRVAEACLACGSHYVDLADGRRFVEEIVVLHSAAQAAGLCVISGASSVPALSSAAVDHLAQGLKEIQTIDIGISPGNRTERGLSTVQAILSYCGKPLPGPDDTFGWVGSYRHAYPAPVGERLLSPCDVPDLALLPHRYPGKPRVRFGAGLELRTLHRGMNAMARLARWGLVPDWSVHAPLLKRAADVFQTLGSDAGAMHVTVKGTTTAGDLSHRTWHLVATHGDGPYVPTLAAAALVRKLKNADGSLAGARPCVGILSLEDFIRECDGLQIQMTGPNE
ncbi:hypothetical protein J2W49_001662 [Hydrogenophaga palleronii]|uniref:Saccharopine dehydrogenase NADP binding domain-containing protein n=1 Tax=Hydrogenophaga palleronii TaxID=65655 RepID=A0ABU1WKZ8_9BURK|nr:saccharopine dehydrogenase NADP-binding domain-containing protein [Hydrogenophaga palleronii]MDR7149707.1 hypothetical protein [Hydrogenophaga palleronii]